MRELTAPFLFLELAMVLSKHKCGLLHKVMQIISCRHVDDAFGKMKNSIIGLILIFSGQIFPSTYTTIASGDWDDGAIWAGGSAPSFTSNDSIFINHDVNFNSSLIIGEYLKINSGAVLCGHKKLEIQTGVLENYGNLKVDTLHLSQSNAWNYSGADMIIKYYAWIYNAGSNFYNQGGSMAVGPDFNCVNPKDDVRTIEEKKLTVSVFPSPTALNSIINFIFAEQDKCGTLMICDNYGRLRRELLLEEGKCELNTSGFKSGIYFFYVNSAGETAAGKFILLR